MQDLNDQLEQIPRGAEFVRADLHIHSFGQHGSYDVTDSAMTPEAIVNAATTERLGIIAITDHNEIRNVEAAIAAADEIDLLVVPGVELSTPQGHLLAYAPTYRDLELFYGKLSISNDRKICSNTMEQCLTLVSEHGGFGIAAHIDLATGLEGMMRRFDAFKQAVLMHPGLLGLEISRVTAQNDKDTPPSLWYTDRDSDPNRKTLHRLRVESQGEDDGYELPRIMGSDAHGLAALGKNAAGARKLTRIKIDEATFDALKVALLDPVARVRIEDLIPLEVPHFVGMSVSGGFLDGQLVRFSRNLTCIIGGRGTGKSTLLESLRAASGNDARDTILDSDVWPDHIYLLYRDQAGRETLFGKGKYYPVVNHSDPADGVTSTSIESYGQGETAETIQHCDKDPVVLLDFLDSFIDLGPLRSEDETLREGLLINQTRIERLRLELNALPDLQKAKLNAESQLKTLREKDASAIVDLEERLARGRKFKEDLIARLRELFKGHQEALVDTGLSDLVDDSTASQLVVGQEQFQSVKTIVEAYVKVIHGLAKEIKDTSKSTIQSVKGELAKWNAHEADTQVKIDDIRKELEAKGVRLDLAFIRKITKDVADFSTRVADLKAKKDVLAKALAERKNLLKDRREVRSRITAARSAFAVQLNENLKSTIIEYRVHIKFHEGVLSRQVENIIKDAMGWRTSQVPKAALIASQVPVFGLLDAITASDSKVLTGIKGEDGDGVFRLKEAKQILQTLDQETIRNTIERCQFEDCPEISVTKEVDTTNGKRYIKRDFGKLSLGQQQSVLLSILLFSKSNEPLVIDQPEDNLDSEFIYKTFVRTLRKVKETRQVIIVTHNANIAVLGDAELIIPLRASSDKSIIRDRGSIDNINTRELACTILEGSREAFAKRRKMYGH